MATLVVPDVPPELVTGLSQLPPERRQRLLTRAIVLLSEALRQEAGNDGGPPRRLPDPPGPPEELTPPTDLPRPGAGEPIAYRTGTDRLPEGLDPAGD